MNRLLCLTDRSGDGYCLAGVDGERLTVVAASELAADLARLVEHLSEHGASSHGLTVRPGHALFLGAAAEAFAARQHQAHVFPADRARAWFLLKTMPFGDEALRHLLLVSLPNLEEPEAADLLAQLEATAAELEAIDRRLEEALGKKLDDGSQEQARG